MTVEEMVEQIKNHKLCSTNLTYKLNEFLFNIKTLEEIKIFPKHEEIFFPIINYIDYMASSFGKIYSIKSKKYLKPFVSNSGYNVVSLCKDNNIKKFSIHRLVCGTFRSNHNKDLCVDHINGDKLDNHINNLRWATHSFNQLNRYRSNL